MSRFLLALAIAASFIGASPAHGVKPVSTDGEATVYLTGNFSRGFNVSYNAVLPPQRGNRSTTFLGLMLLGRRTPGPSISLGLTRVGSSQSLQVFVATTNRERGSHYESFPAGCLPACGLVLRGDRYALYAFIVTADGIRRVGAWGRADFELAQPYVQLNAEVTAPGDRMVATLIPMRLVVDSADIAPARCAFTTRGIEPRRDPSGMIEFSGVYRRDAAASFIDLKTGRMVDRC